jgi:hypothetical protein
VAKRAVVLIVALGLLSGLGMPLRRPCCSLAEVASSVSSPDCCPMPDCCRGEKRGSSPIVLSSPLESPPAPVLISGQFFPPPPAASFARSGSPVEIASLHGPPALVRDLPVLLSSLRV